MTSTGGLYGYVLKRRREEYEAKQEKLRKEASYLTPEQFAEKYGPFEKPVDLPKGAMITEVTPKNGRITIKYTYERTDKFAQYMEQKREQEVSKARASLTTEPPKQVYQEWVLNLFPHLRKTEPVTWHRVAGWKETITPTQFAEKYGTEKPDLPKGAEIMYVRKSGIGYEIRYQTPAKTVTEQFVRALKEPMIRGYGESDIVGVREVHGKSVMGDLTVPMLTFPVMLGEATIGEYEEHVMKKPTERSELMTPEQIALSYGMIAGGIAVGYFGPKIWSKIRPSTVKGITVTPISKTSRLQVTPWVKGGKKTPFATTLGRALKDSRSGMAGFVRQQAIPKTTRLTEPTFIPYMTITPKMPIGLEAFVGVSRGSLVRMGLAQMTVSKPTLRFARVPSLAQVQKDEQKQVQMLRQLQGQKVGVAQALRLRQVQKQKQLRIRHHRPELDPFRTRRRKDIRSAWFKKVHPIKTHQEMNRLFFGSRTKRKKRKRKKKRR